MGGCAGNEPVILKMAQFFHMIAKNCKGVPVTKKRPPLWLDTDLDSYLREQDAPGGNAVPAPGGPLQATPDDSIQDRRRATRQLLSGFAVVHTLDPDGRRGRYRVAQLRDISTTGFGLRLNSTEPESFAEGREFEVLFQFSDHGKPLHMACTACRKALDEAGVIIGAVFRNPLGSLAEVSC
jgi:hypothetical protein